MSPGKTDKPNNRGKTAKPGRATESTGSTTDPGTTDTPQPRSKSTRPRRQKTDPLIASELDATNSPRTEPAPIADAPPGDDGLDAEIQAQAYAIYLSRGSADGDAISDWLEAERTVRKGRRRPDTEERAPT